MHTTSSRTPLSHRFTFLRTLPAFLLAAALLTTTGCDSDSLLGTDPFDEGAEIAEDGTSADGSSDTFASHEPGNYSLITSRSFEQRVEDGWGDSGSHGFSITSDDSAPASCCTVGQARYRAGMEGGVGPARIWRSFADRGDTEVYISYWVKFSDNWQGHASSVNKIAFVWIHGDPSVVVSATGGGDGPLRPQLRLQDIPDGAINLSANVNDVTIERGKWHHWEIQLISNSDGQRNGVGRVWIDGQLAVDHRDVRYAAANQSRHWESVYWNPTWGGMGDQVEEEMFMWMDRFHMSGRK